MDQSLKSVPAPPDREASVVAAVAYATGRRVAEIPVEEAGE
jgi:hypothetical protein